MKPIERLAACSGTLILSVLIAMVSAVFPIQASGGVIETYAGGLSGSVPPLSTNLKPNSLAMDGQGNLYAIDGHNNRIIKIDPTGTSSTTVAGNGVQGFSGDDGPATKASFSLPTGIAVDSQGNIFIADFSNHRVRKVRASDNVITTVAGSGEQGFSGDGGPATEAKLSSPYGVSVDTQGNLFIADYYNCVIRKVSASNNIITTVAGNGSFGYSGDGGSATQARIGSPYGITVDAQGNLYIADYNNYRVRKVNSSDSIITTVAGNGTPGFSGDGASATQASLNSPTDVMVDAQGNLFIADTNNNRVRKVNTTANIITTVAGNGIASFSGDGGPATQANIRAPYGMVVDAQGNLFIADTNNYRIRKVSSSNNIINTVAGNGTATFSGNGVLATSAALSNPRGVAVDGQGNIYIADTYANLVRKINVSDNVITTITGNLVNASSGDGGPAGQASTAMPCGVAVDSQGDLYIADTNSFSIRKVTAKNGVIDNSCIITTLVGNGTATDSGDGGPATLAGLSFPYGVAIDSQRNLYIAVYGNRIRKVNASSNIITTVAGNGTPGFSGDGGLATEANLNNAISAAVDASGNIYIVDFNNFRIRKVSADDNIITTVAGNGTQGFSGDGGLATQASFMDIRGVAVDAQGNIYITDLGNQRIRMVNATNNIITTVAGNGTRGFSGDGGIATQATLSNPHGIATDSNGDLFFTDFDANRVRWINMKPYANFTYTPTRGARGLSVAFTNTTRTASGTTYVWNFGDNTTINLANPIHVYPNKGIYSVSLTATGLPGLPANMTTKNVQYAICVGYIFSAYSDTANTAPFTRSYSRSGNLYSRVWATLSDVNYNNIKNATLKVIDSRARSVSVNLTNSGGGIFSGSVSLSTLAAGSGTATFTITDKSSPSKTFTATENITLQ